MNQPSKIAAALHPNEAARLAALRSYGILDTGYESAFDDITRIASYVCETPIAVVNLIDHGRQWFKSEIGLGVRETPIESSICAHAILENSFLEVPDTTQDRRFECNPLVTGEPHLRFYAGALLRTPDGLPLGTVCVLDYKPRKLSPGQREIMAALARQVMSQMELRRALLTSDLLQRNVSRLMAVAGHDLKQPLQVMIMAIDRIRGRNNEPRDQERLDQAVAAGMRLAAELDILAETSLLQSGDGIPRTGPVSLNDLFGAIRNTWQSHAEAKGLHLVIVPTSVAAVSDSGMLRTILGNLVGNAIKYTERGRILIGCRRRGAEVAIEVLDSGVGIATQHLETIFDAFHQINPGSDGLGLGLSIVRRTAEALSHRIEVKSEPGCGTRFSIILPRAVG